MIFNDHDNADKEKKDEEEDCTDSLLGLESVIAVDGNKSAAKRSCEVVFLEQEWQKQQHHHNQQQQQQQQQTPSPVTVDLEAIAVVYAATTGHAACRAQRCGRDLALLIQHPTETTVVVKHNDDD